MTVTAVEHLPLEASDAIGLVPPDNSVTVQTQRGFRWHAFSPGDDAFGRRSAAVAAVQLPHGKQNTLSTGDGSSPTTDEASEAGARPQGDIAGEQPGTKRAKPEANWKWCTYPGCDKYVVSRRLCIAHGGGRRCKMEGCTKSGQVNPI